MDPKEQLCQVELEMAKDEAGSKRLSRTDAAGGNKPPTGKSIWGGGTPEKLERKKNELIDEPHSQIFKFVCG